jgi:hypothetical protein
MNPRRPLLLTLLVVTALPCTPALAQRRDAAPPHGTGVALDNPGGNDTMSPVPPAGRVDLWFRAGLFEPSDDTLAEVYSGARVPFIVQADWRLLRHLAVFGSLRDLRVTGRAIVESGTASSVDGSATHLTTTSGRFGGLVIVPSGRWDLRFGGGVSVNHYFEEWPAAGVSATGTRTGWLAQAALARRFGRRWLAGASVEYSSVRVPAGSGEFAAPALELGGADVLFGGGIRF